MALSNACSDKGWNTYKSEDGMRVPNIPMQAIKIQQRNDGQYKIYGRAHGWCVRYK